MRLRILPGLRWLLLLVAGGVTLTPFVWLVCAAFKTPEALMTHDFLPPPGQWSRDLTLDNFRQLFAGEASAAGTVYFITYLLNSLFLAAAHAVLTTVTCSLTGYVLAKHRFRGRAGLMLLMLGTMMLPSMLLLAPTYRLLFQLGWLDSWLCLLIPGMAPAFGVFLFRQAMVQVPDELLDAARIDGAGEWRIWWTVVMPLVRPMTGAWCLIAVLGAWGSFLAPQVFLSSADKLTLPVVLNQYLELYRAQYGVFLAGTLIAIIPPAVLFFALQREFIGGLSQGAVKG